MKFIQKQKSPQEFQDWILEDQKVGYSKNEWTRIPGEIKSKLRQSLLSDQGYLCCYCERRIHDKNSDIEHILPRSIYPLKMFDFTNLLCSCQKDIQKDPLHCGNAKGNWYDPNLFISPLDPYCESHFAYAGDGDIRSADPKDRAAKETIKKLHLNIDKLRAMRSKAIEPFLDLEGKLSQQERNKFIQHYLQKQNREFQEFYSTIQYLFNHGYI